MKKNFFLLLILLFVGCKTLPPEVIEFRAEPSIVNEGEKTVIYWNISNADEISITGIGENLSSVGFKEISLVTSTTLVMEAKKGSTKIVKSLTVEVTPRKTEKPKPKPVVEKRSTQKTNYIKGIVNAENVKVADEPQLIVNLIDAKLYPNKIKVYCTVKDKYGNQIANLAPPYNYEYLSNWKAVFEEIYGKEYEINDFEVEEVREEIAPPFSSTFILDFSGSMYDDHQFVTQAVRKAMSFLRKEKDDYEVIQFDHRIFKSINLTSDVNLIKNLIPFDNLAGWTAFYEASVFGLDEIKKSPKEKVAILFTDGMDNASLYTAFDVILKAREIGAKVFVIGFNRAFGGFIPFILEAIALQTGGKTYFPSSISELEDIFFEIYRIMNVYYIVTYEPIKKEGNVHIVKLILDFSLIDKTLTATKAYYVNPEPLDEKRKITIAWFETGSSNIKNEYLDNLKKLVDFLKDNPHKKIIIYGHTDSRGSDAFNYSLSLKRANAVTNKLLEFGLNRNQVKKIVGKGEKELLFPNESNEYELQENRRVEIEIVD